MSDIVDIKMGFRNRFSDNSDRYRKWNEKTWCNSLVANYLYIRVFFQQCRCFRQRMMSKLRIKSS